MITAHPSTETESRGESARTLEELFRLHGPLVYQTARRVTGNALDAEDVLQTVFARLAGRAEFSGLAPNPRAYLCRAALNGALDLVRSRHSAVGTLPLEERADPGRLPDAESELKRLRSSLRRAVGHLAPRAAEVFVLRALDGHPNREVARILGSSPAVVAVQYHRARAQLRKALLEETGEQS